MAGSNQFGRWTGVPSCVIIVDRADPGRSMTSARAADRPLELLAVFLRRLPRDTGGHSYDRRRRHAGACGGVAIPGPGLSGE